jgi:uncharacterized protein involved in outer membrane biogenesis
MFDPRKIDRERVTLWARRTVQLGSSRRARKIAVWTLAVIAFLGIAGFFGVPPLLRHVLVGQVAKTLNRPVSVGQIRFDLYTLGLDIDQLQVGEPANAQDLIDVEHLRVRVSWTSIFRLAPVIKEVAITRPVIHVVRSAEQRFNFSDLLERPAPAEKPKTTSSKPQRFAVSNIRILDGEINFDDQVLGEHHRIEHLNLGIPFIANLPADVDIYVQPLLEMIIDGSAMRIVGKAKPFASPPESVVDLRLHRLDLHRYVGYAPKRIAIKVPAGTLSCDVQVHFVNGSSTDARPQIRLSGAVALDQVELRDRADGPLLELKHAVVKLADVEPLNNLISMRQIWIDGLVSHLALNPDGTTNLTSVIGSDTTPAAAPTTAAHAVPLTQDSPIAEQKSPTNFSIESFEVSESSVKLADNRGATPNPVSLDDIHVALNKFHTVGQGPATYDVSAKLGGGGSIALKGALNMAQQNVASELSIAQVDLPSLQGFAKPMFAGNLASGKLTATASLRTDFAKSKFNLHAEPANISIENVKVESPRAHETPIQCSSLSAAIGQIDLATHQAIINEVRADGLQLSVKRGRRGDLSLLELIQPTSRSPKIPRRAAVKAPIPAAAETPPAQTWSYHIASVALENTAARFEDHSTAQRADLALAPLTIHLKDVSSDLSKPIVLDISGMLNQKGSFKVTGTAAPIPLSAKLQVVTDRLELAPLDPYVSSQLNAKIAGAALTMKGGLSLDSVRKQLHVSYKGDAALGNVNAVDKVTGDSFLVWKTLSVTRINLRSGDGPLHAHVGAVALDDFYARVILRENGTMNLKEVMANPKSAPTSITRTDQPPGAVTAPLPSPETPAASPKADIEIGKITLDNGHVNYSDNFIQPNYAADLTDIRGDIGKFGTGTTETATVLVDGEVNGSSPIDISGSLNPLAPKASLDIRAKADGVELTGLTPYSNNYAGYPILKGTLTLNVHYLLKDGNLTAENHIFIDQLTFGERIEGSKASKLPLRLAIALLKNSKGQIDLDIPVSGSLSDPKFSVTDVIWSALKNIIIKAATAPFSLLASAIPGGHGAEQAPYVEFAPGLATLSLPARDSLTTLASALQARPSLRLNIEGRIDPTLDQDGLREAALNHSIKEKSGKGGTDPDSVELTPSENAKYLGKVYSAAKFAKPKNIVGLDKSIPPDDMKKMLLANIQVTAADLRHLADARAAAVRRFMSQKVDPGRLFLTAPKLSADGIEDKGKTTRVDLSFD